MRLSYPTLTLRNNVEMPVIGLGTSQGTADDIRQALRVAITEAHYPLFETSDGNEEIIGEVLEEIFHEGKIKRDYVFITTKLSVNNLHPERSEAALRERLQRLRLERVDLLIADFPTTNVDDNSVSVEEVWKGLESIYDKNLTRAIGVSNATVQQIERIMKVAVWPIHNAQCSGSPHHDLVEVCRKHRITLTSLLSRNDASSTSQPETVEKVASKYGKTPVQILLRSIIDRGLAVIHDSINPTAIHENINVVDFALTENDIESLEAPRRTTQNGPHSDLRPNISRIASPVFTHLSSSDSVLLVCDLQEKFSRSIFKFAECVTVASRLVAAASVLEMPIIGTEQYPKGLGHLVPELGLSEGTPVFAKTKFSMLIPPVEQLLSSSNPKSVILCGVEAHVCVLQTTLDLLERGIAVHVVVDATSSRSSVDRTFAFKQMERAGAILTTSESVILGMCEGAEHPKFKQIQKVIMELAPDTGLAGI